jgi:hypothetical protein
MKSLRVQVSYRLETSRWRGVACGLVGLEALPGFRRKVQMEKKNIVAPNRTAVSARLDALGNLICRKSSTPDKAATSKPIQPSTAELIRFDNDRPKLKKYQRIREEFMKSAIQTPQSH